MSDPQVVIASASFNCVKLDKASGRFKSYGVKFIPADVFVSPDRKLTYVWDEPVYSPAELAARLRAMTKVNFYKPAVKAHSGYPIRGRWWYQDGAPVTWRHLLIGEHAGKFDEQWLRQLYLGEVNSLHADDHEGIVHWEYVVRPPSQAVEECPNGVCPVPNQPFGGGYTPLFTNPYGGK
jgi:hypothetical protein